MRASCRVVPRTAPNGVGFEAESPGPTLLWPFLPPIVLDDQAFVIVRRFLLDVAVASAVAHLSWRGGRRCGGTPLLSSVAGVSGATR